LRGNRFGDALTCVNARVPALIRTSSTHQSSSVLDESLADLAEKLFGELPALRVIDLERLLGGLDQ